MKMSRILYPVFIGFFAARFNSLKRFLSFLSVFSGFNFMVKIILVRSTVIRFLCKRPESEES